MDVAAASARGLGVVDLARAVLGVRPALLQLRAKSTGARDTLTLLRALAPLCRAAGTLLFANDRPDLAVLAGADGVHLGQSDLAFEDARRFAPGLRVGISTHDPTELEAALALRPDYVAFGPVFATASKAQPEPCVGLPALARAAESARRAGVPLVAIGGIDLERAAEVGRHQLLGAVIGALLPSSGGLEEAAERAVRLHVALGG